MNTDKLRNEIINFARLEENWDSYNADKITESSIETAKHYLDTIIEYKDKDISVFPTRDGGIQFEIGEFIEIEILNEKIIHTEFDNDLNIIYRSTIFREELQ